MSESFATTYAKAVDDLAGKIFIPGLIASLVVEFGPWYQSINGAGLVETYIALAVAGGMFSGLIFWLLAMASIYVNSGRDVAPVAAIFIMPLGFAGLFPEHFGSFVVPYSKVTGVAILAWSFMLLKNGSFGDHA